MVRKEKRSWIWKEKKKFARRQKNQHKRHTFLHEIELVLLLTRDGFSRERVHSPWLVDFTPKNIQPTTNYAILFRWLKLTLKVKKRVCAWHNFSTATLWPALVAMACRCAESNAKTWLCNWPSWVRQADDKVLCDVGLSVVCAQLVPRRKLFSDEWLLITWHRPSNYKTVKERAKHYSSIIMLLPRSDERWSGCYIMPIGRKCWWRKRKRNIWMAGELRVRRQEHMQAWPVNSW